ncbi:hypothetical protein P3S67_021030 [Capsicum chacoense]
MGRVTPVFLFLLSLVFPFATYSLITMITRYTTVGFGRWKAGGLVSLNTQLVSGNAASCTTGIRKKKDLPGSEMGKFTRILHSGSPDNLMDEIPTFVVDPLPDGLDRGYIVLNRPWAFVQWLEKATIEEEYILMAEPDHNFCEPAAEFSLWRLPCCFPFFLH